MIASPKWLTSIGSATALMHCATLYPPSLSVSDLSDSNSRAFQSSKAFQFTSDTSRRLMANEPSLRTSNFTSDGDGVYRGMLKVSNCSSLWFPAANSKKIYIHASCQS